MTWTYSGDPSSNPRDAVRFEIGDTIITDPQIQDEELDYVLTLHSSTLGAALHCCEVLARKYARQADSQLGPQRVYASQRSLAYRELARELRSRLASAHAPSAGGILKQEEESSDVKRGAFRRNLMTRPARRL